MLFSELNDSKNKVFSKVYTYINKYVHTCVCIRINMYIHMYIYLYSQRTYFIARKDKKKFHQLTESPIEGSSLSPSIPYCCDVRGVSEELSIVPSWYRETPVFQMAERLLIVCFTVWLQKWDVYSRVRVRVIVWIRKKEKKKK